MLTKMIGTKRARRVYSSTQKTEDFGEWKPTYFMSNKIVSLLDGGLTFKVMVIWPVKSVKYTELYFLVDLVVTVLTVQYSSEAHSSYSK